MNKGVVILAVVFVGLLGLLWVSSERAANVLANSQQETLTCSNQLSEARLKLDHQERLTAALKAQLEECGVSFLQSSNQLLQLRGEIAAARTAQATTQAAVGNALAQSEAIAAARNDFSNRVMELELQLRETKALVQAAHERAFAAQTNQGALSQEVFAARAETEQWKRQWNDLAALQRQLKELSTPLTTSATNRTATVDSRGRLLLQPDGSVVLAPQ